MQQDHRVLVTGASGFIGRHTVEGLVERGFKVRAAVRRPLGPTSSAEIFQISNLDAHTDWTGALKDVQSVVHLAGRAHRRAQVQAREIDTYRDVNVAGTEHLAREAAAAGVGRLVYVSSIAVNGSNTTGRAAFRADDPPAPKTPYGSTKLEAERRLEAAQAASPGFGVDIARCPVVIGSGAPGNLALMEWALRRRIPMPFGAVRNLRAFLGVGDLVDFIALRVTARDAGTRRFMLAAPDLISTPDLFRHLALVLNRSAVLFPFPTSAMRTLLTAARREDKADALIEDLVIDTASARSAGWSARTTIREAVERAYGR